MDGQAPYEVSAKSLRQIITDIPKNNSLNNVTPDRNNP